MIEKMLIDSGCKCGTKKNLSTQISTDLKNGSGQHWYFLTPLKSIDKGGELKEVTVNFAFPFISQKGDISEQDVFSRISLIKNEYENGLINFIKKWFIIQTFNFSIIPFYGGGSGERSELTNFGNNKIHLLNGVFTFRYREKWFNCNCK